MDPPDPSIRPTRIYWIRSKDLLLIPWLLHVTWVRSQTSQLLWQLSRIPPQKLCTAITTTSFIPQATPASEHSPPFGTHRTTLLELIPRISFALYLLIFPFISEHSPPFHRMTASVNTMNILRPLSPHLPIYKPQLTSTFSIFHRITGAFLSTMVLGFYLVCLKAGLICFTFESFYQFLFSSSKLILLSLEISTLALSYHLFHGVRHLLTDFSGNLFLGRKRFK